MSLAGAIAPGGRGQLRFSVHVPADADEATYYFNVTVHSKDPTVNATVEVPFMQEKTMRYPGHIEKIRVLDDQEIRSEFERVLRAAYAEGKIEIDTLIHEDGAAQMEINLIHGDAMSLADQVFMFKRTAREAGVKHATGFNYRFIPAIRLAKHLIETARKDPVQTAHILRTWLYDTEN